VRRPYPAPATGSTQLAPETLLAWRDTRLGRQQRVHHINFRAELPRNANGKFLKREVRAPRWR